jgi:hypothetical protein
MHQSKTGLNFAYSLAGLPMHTYRILRDNKEKGPFSMEELLALQLKPYDLIWVEGKSAGWRYPSEIDSLKPYLNDGNETEAKITVQSHPASQNIRSSANLIPAAAPQLPVHYNDTIETEEELTEENLERKAAELYQRIQSFNQKTEEQQQGVQTKYAKSLDDLKQEYANWLHEKKGKKNRFGKKTVIAGGAGILVVALGIFFILGRNTNNSIPFKEQKLNIISSAAAIPEPLEKKVAASPKVKENNILQIKPVESQSSRSSVDEFIDSVERVMAKSSRGKKITYQKKVYDFPAGRVNQSVAESTNTKQAPAAKSQASLYQLVHMNANYQQDANRHNISSLEVTIKNNTETFLKTVTVDVFYYKKGDRLFDKETLYFNNILPGNSLTISSPGNKKAVTAKFQLGQINTAAN